MDVLFANHSQHRHTSSCFVMLLPSELPHEARLSEQDEAYQGIRLYRYISVHGWSGSVSLGHRFCHLTVIHANHPVRFIIGLSWGGSSYPWKSAPVISTIIIGFFLLVALFIYESKVTLAEPLIPMQLFQDRGWNASAAILSVGATVYYAMAIIWPQMAVTVYGNGNAMYAGWISCLVGVAITSGELCGGMGQKLFQYTGWQCMVCMTIGTATLGGKPVLKSLPRPITKRIHSYGRRNSRHPIDGIRPRLH